MGFMKSRVNGQLVAIPNSLIAVGLPYAFRSEQNAALVVTDPTTQQPLVNVDGNVKPFSLNGIPGPMAVQQAKLQPEKTRQIAQQQAEAIRQANTQEEVNLDIAPEARVEQPASPLKSKLTKAPRAEDNTTDAM